MMGQSETSFRSEIIFSTLFSAGAKLRCTFHQPPQTVFLIQTRIFWLLFIQFYCAGLHSVSTAAGVALMKEIQKYATRSYKKVLDEYFNSWYNINWVLGFWKTLSWAGMSLEIHILQLVFMRLKVSFATSLVACGATKYTLFTSRLFSKYQHK